MQTPPSSSSASVAGDSPRMQRKSGEQDTPRRLALPKMPNFLTLASPKRLHNRDKEQHQQENASARDKNEPSRFLGDGVSFKAKLIGILEVGEARGDRMCQEALADLKMAIRAAGEHKQRITINIAIDGLRLRDEKTMDCLYHHPVHKISFIAQDMTDSRAFGYIFGSPDTGHRFFGIKTDKAAGQVVVAMRDLFQVVFELKKKEIELAKQHIEQQQMKFSVGKSLENLTYTKSLLDSGSRYSALKDDSKLENGCMGAASKSAQQTSEVIADLLDLEIELNSIQQGIHQMEKITPSDPFGPDANKDASFYDPFEDSFSPPPMAVVLPPPPPSTRASSKRHLSLEPSSPPPANTSATTSPTPTPQTITTKAIAPLATTETWFDTTSDPLFGDNNTTSTTSGVGPTTMEQAEQPSAPNSSNSQYDVFTELDPLGTGRVKPYVDKKDFFQELKNPPKKVLKELVEPRDSEASTFATSFGTSPPVHSGRKTPSQSKYSAEIMALDPFADSDPFGEPDFVEESFPQPESADPFDTCFADFTMFGSQKSDKSGNATDVFHGPLRVSLPPDKRGASLLPPPPASSKRASPIMKSSPKSPRSPLKQKPSVSEAPMVRIPSPKSTRRRTGAIRKSPLADDERISNSSAELADIAPEPPPRPASSKPPPLPPKKQQTGQQYKPPRPPPCEQYDYINNIEAPVSVSSPPLPMPVRRPRTSSSGTEIPRPRQHSQQQESVNFSLPPPPAKEEKKPKVAANLTLRQLTKMNITELASSLNVSPGHLSKMTLQELAGFLSSVSAEGSPSSNKEVSVEPQKAEESEPVEIESYTALRESLDGEDAFKVDFENNFADFSSSDFQNSKEDVFQEAPFDKYAVFRELEQEDQAPADTVEDNTETAEFEDAVQDSIKEEAELPRSDSAMAEEGLRDEELEDYTEDGDKYAALRDICSEEPGVRGEGDESDKDDSESVTKKVEEDLNLLSISRQPSDSPESVTMDATNVRESIIESTILEEEVASDGGSQYEEPVETPVEKQPLQDEEEEEMEPESELPLNKEDQDEETYNQEEPESAEPSPEKVVSPPTELSLPDDRRNDESRSPGGGWAKFEEEEDKKLEEPATSPWSVESKEFGSKVFTPEKAYTPDSTGGSRRHRYNRSSRESPWQDDEDDDDDDWEDRENGWRDEHYRRPRKRSPWGSRAKRASPWEDDDESCEEVAYKPRRPPRASSANRRPPSWDDEEGEYDEPRRRPIRYEEKRDRSGSRGEYTSRRREWEEQRSKYANAYATWADRVPRKTSSQERRSRDPRDSAASRRKQYDSHYYNYRPPEYDEPYDPRDPRYKSKKTPGGPKRPSSATDVRKGGRSRGRHSPEDDEDEIGDPEPAAFNDGRFRTTSADPARHWQDDFNSDHEAPREQHYEQRSYTMHSKRRQKRREDFYNSQKSPFDDDFSTRSFHATEFSSIESPTAETVRRQVDDEEQTARLSSTKASIGSSRRSPFEDDFTPPETRRGSGRMLSSISSDISRSPHDPALVRSDDVFLPEDPESHEQKRKQRWSEDRQLSGIKNRLSSSTRMAAPHDANNIKKSESVNIFSRDGDPFDDDFFAETERPRKKNNGDAFKWSEPNFGSFDFKEEDEEEEE
ncbi:protein disabled isoform X2 [Neocloeon triangulifer]|uniref:protein disabled isoform X2 n=1 Tax=Neocloeon triangulifer TaxID=2078957 RepID=UPI00286F0FA0|nr:protein disabled isoform X2 [Neocloeon triangulifer]